MGRDNFGEMERDGDNICNNFGEMERDGGDNRCNNFGEMERNADSQFKFKDNNGLSTNLLFLY